MTDPKASSYPAHVFATRPSEQQPSARQVGSVLGHLWWIVVLMTLVGGGVAAAAVYVVPQRSIGTTTLLVDIPVQASDTEALVRTVETLITSQAVLSDVAEQPGVELSPQVLDDAIEVERATGSAVIEITVINGSRDRVQTISEEIVPALQARLQEVESSVATTTTGVRGRRGPAAVQPGSENVPLSVTTFGTEPYVRDYSWSLVPTSILGALGGALVGGLLVVVVALRRLNQ